jgi:A/G-specific adenine glycosylase
MNMDKKRFAALLLDWYSENKRELPWRKTKDPYKIWLSEVLLQQTRVSQGLPYYLSFEKKFSTVKKLAAAPEKEVLRLWQGLGYYSRARNLHKCAKIVAHELRERFPQTADELKKLPGIGDYTAAAIASLAFNQPAAVVDGNVFRALSRLFGIDLNIASPAGKKYFFQLANSLIPHENPGEFNQAMMEFGARHCTPRNPKCGECVFVKQCVAFQTERQTFFPVKSKMKKRRVRYFNYFVIRSGKKIWMKTRSEKDIWEGLHEFYLMESNRQLSDVNAVQLFSRKIGVGNLNETKSVRIGQILSHQEITGKFFNVELRNGALSKLKGGKFCSLQEIDRLAKPVLISQYLKQMTLRVKSEKK